MKSLALVLVLTVIPAAAQLGLSDWTAVRQLPHGKEISVQTASRNRIIGKLSAVSDSAIVVKVNRRDQSILRGDVRRVSRRLPPQNRRLFSSIGIALGVTAGLLSSVPLPFKQCGASCNDEKAATAGLVIGLPVAGAIVGRRLAGKGEWDLVYAP